jgi:hypothetical protein
MPGARVKVMCNGEPVATPRADDHGRLEIQTRGPAHWRVEVVPE